MFKSIAETESSDVKVGLDLVSFMKEELELCPSRKCLDFLLHACVNAKDKQSALLVWEEYQCAELPYNVINYLRQELFYLLHLKVRFCNFLSRKFSSGERVMYNEFLVYMFSQDVSGSSSCRRFEKCRGNSIKDS